MLKQAHALPRRGGFQGDGKGSRMSDCSRRHQEGFQKYIMGTQKTREKVALSINKQKD